MPSPVKFLCNSQDLFRAAEKHLGFKNVWPEDVTDARNLILNLLELVKKKFRMDVKVVCTSRSTDEGGVIFSVQLTPIEEGFFEIQPGPEEFRRVVQELQEIDFESLRAADRPL
ncbi:MAG: hypothetical protein L0387_14135 [Acidobacteria bacterium]|nr:hypothetical protein [Acidobacteriota bacterium]